MSGATRYVICRGVGRLQFSEKYYIGLRIAIASGDSLDSTTSDQKFGTIDLKVLKDDGTESVPYLVERTELMEHFTLL